MSQLPLKSTSNSEFFLNFMKKAQNVLCWLLLTQTRVKIVLSWAVEEVYWWAESARDTLVLGLIPAVSKLFSWKSNLIPNPILNCFVSAHSKRKKYGGWKLSLAALPEPLTGLNKLSLGQKIIRTVLSSDLAFNRDGCRQKSIPKGDLRAI